MSKRKKYALYTHDLGGLGSPELNKLWQTYGTLERAQAAALKQSKDDGTDGEATTITWTEKDGEWLGKQSGDYAVDLEADWRIELLPER